MSTKTFGSDLRALGLETCVNCGAVKVANSSNFPFAYGILNNGKKVKDHILGITIWRKSSERFTVNPPLCLDCLPGRERNKAIRKKIRREEARAMLEECNC